MESKIKHNVLENEAFTIKITTTHNNFTQIYIAGKVGHAVRNSELIRIWSTNLNVYNFENFKNYNFAQKPK